MVMIVAPPANELVKASYHRPVVQNALGFEDASCRRLQSLQCLAGRLNNQFAVIILSHVLPKKVEAVIYIGDSGLRF